MAWSLYILGTNAAVPSLDRNPSAQALDTEHEVFLVDCGEATQTRLAEFRVRRSRIQHIFISHLHGDHIFGLPGLITSFNLFGREDPLFIYGPRGLKHYLDVVNETTGIHLNYHLQIKEHDDQISRKILETGQMQVYTIPLDHRTPTTGYLFREKVFKRKIDTEAIERLKVPYEHLRSIQNGKDWKSPDGQWVRNEEMTQPGREPISYAYCSDTRYHPKIVPLIRNTNVLYHEATFGSELSEEAHRRGHSTAREAALIAKAAGVDQLIIGHFSNRYSDTSILLKEAREHFANTVIARDGMVVPIDSEEKPRI